MRFTCSCAAYTTNVLGPVYKSELKGIVDLDYVGWGNAKNSSGSISCQHGSRECKLNKALNCAQHECRSVTCASAGRTKSYLLS